MPVVTIPGAHHTTVALQFDSDANAAIALHVASLISAGLGNNTILAADSTTFPAPSLPSGVTGELVQTRPGVTVVPKGYDYFVDAARTAIVFGNGDANEKVLAGGGDLTFYAAGGSGIVDTGGGNNLIAIPITDAGPWLIATGHGNDTIRAVGGGNDTISAGGGHNAIQLGAGETFVTTTGADTILAGKGSATIAASGAHATDLIYGNASQLFFVAGGGATVFGGRGSDTLFGGAGADLFYGGSAGGNFLQAGGGRATLFGGGDGDQLFAGGHRPQELHAGSGNETLFGGFASGNDTFYGGSGHDQIFGGQGKNTFVAGTGAATVTASPDAKNLFEFMHSAHGGHELVLGLTDAAQVHISLLGYGADEVRKALAGQSHSGDGVTITLSDHTTVTFQNIGHLTASNFTGGGGAGEAFEDHDRGHGHWSGHGDRG